MNLKKVFSLIFTIWSLVIATRIIWPPFSNGESYSIFRSELNLDAINHVVVIWHILGFTAIAIVCSAISYLIFNFTSDHKTDLQ